MSSPSDPPPGHWQVPGGDADPAPPGAPAPLGGRPTWAAGATPYGGAGWAPRPAYQPGTVPLRPLTLADIYDGAFKTIRRNPKATIGVAALVNALFLLLPTLVVVVAGLLDWLPPLIPELSQLDENAQADPAAGFATNALSLFSAFFTWLAGVVVTGLVVQVVARATLGERLGAQDAWDRTRGRLGWLLLLALVNLAVALVLVGVPVGLGVATGVLAGVGAGFAVGLPLTLLGVAALVYVYFRWLLLAPCPLVLEGARLPTAIRRAGTLTKGSFWRVFGIALLALILGGVVSQILQIPFALIGVAAVFLWDGSGVGTMVLLLTTNLSAVLVAAFTSPFIGAVTVLQYVDLRIRREGFDVTLIRHSHERVAPTGGR